MTTSRDQVNRLLALVPYLRTRGEADLAETAAVFAVSTAQLVQDLNVLWYCGLPGGLPGDLIEVDMDGVERGRIRLTNADYLARPLRLTPDEAVSLMVALHAVRELAGPDLEDAVDSALGKLAKVAGATPAVVVSLPSASSQVRGLLTTAIEKGSTVRLTYDGQSRGATTRPVVEPRRLAIRDGYAYLDAWSAERDDWRTYRLDRIVAAEDLQRPAAERGEPPAFDAGWLDRRTDAVEVRLTLRPDAAWVAEYVPVTSAGTVGAGFEVVLRVADPAWLRALLLRLGPRVVAVDPPQAAASARTAAGEALAWYVTG